jgi:alpha-beta hydrolase superfamily lysophospholipase
MIKKSREFSIEGIDNKKIFIRVWDDISNIKGAIQIIHGMAEHSGRYDEFARFLNVNGYIVYADDHRGHGKTEKTKEELGYLGEDGFNKIVEDENIITNFIKNQYKDIPVHIFAHSFGSFIGQEYITRYSKNINGIILSGSAMQIGLDVKLGAVLTKFQRSFIDEKRQAKIIDRLSFGSFNKKVANPINKFAWLSRDESEVDKYIKDEYCGFISSINFYYTLFNGLNGLYKIDKLKNINKELPILVLSGDMDPVGKYGRSVKKLYNQYKNLGIEKVSIKLYEGARHELLNETNRDEVYEYIVKWIKEN